MQNRQAIEAGKRADEFFRQQANPSKSEEENLEEEKEQDVKPVDPEKEKDSAPVQRDDYETRFKRYKAATDSTIHELRTENEKLKDIEASYNSLKEKYDELKSQAPEVPNSLSELYSKEEIAGIKDMIGAEVNALKSEVDRLNGELKEAKEFKNQQEDISIHQQIVNAVTAAVPNFQEIDTNPEFGKYMDGLDEFGNLRSDIFMRAKTQSPPDIGRIVQFYRDFVNSSQAVSKKEETPKDNKQYTQQELLQNPSSTPSERPAGYHGEGIVWDQPTINKFYKDKALGLIKPQRAAELERDLYLSKGYKI